MAATNLSHPDRPPQAERILDAFATWLAAHPGRRVILERAPDGWRSSLVESTERSSGGATLTDAAAQAAQVATCEVTPVSGPTALAVHCYETGSALEGTVSDDLLRESIAASPTGAVPAFQDADGTWRYVQPSQVDDARRHGLAVRTVFVRWEDA